MRNIDECTNEPVYECLWPLGAGPTGSFESANGITDLSGKTIGELWDVMFQGDIMLGRIREELSIRFPGVKFVGHEVFGDTHGAQRVANLARLPAVLKELEVDAVISCVGA